MEENRITLSMEDKEKNEPGDSMSNNDVTNFDQEPNVSHSVSHGESQNSKIPSSSFDDSPFISFQKTKLRKKKTQTKLSFDKFNYNSKKKISDDKQKNSKSGVEDPGISSLSQESSSSNSLLEATNSGVSSTAPYVCPVCWRPFMNKGDQLQHMKACGAKHNLTLKQMLDALDLQARQLEERKILGLPSFPAANTTKKYSSKKGSVGNDKDDPDLQLGLALSVSMKESEDQNLLMEEEVLQEAGLGEEVAAKQASLLDQFGFTSSRPILPSIQPRKKPGKAKLQGTPLLLTRSQEERERLVTEKVAILLSNEEEQSSPIPEVSQGQGVVKYEPRSDRLTEIQQKKCSLWRKASTSPYPKDSGVYYVDLLSYVISASTTKTGSKLKRLSQVPCRLKTPEKLLAARNEQDTPEPQITAVAAPAVAAAAAAAAAAGSSVSAQKQDHQMNPNVQKQPFESKLADDWRTLLYKDCRTDVKIFVSNNRMINVHELVLFTRCPNILHDIIDDDSVKYIEWGEISYDAAIAFLDYVYTGSTTKIHEKLERIIEIYLLSKKYCARELYNYLEVLLDTKENMLFVPDLETDDDSSQMRENESEFGNPQRSEFIAEEESHPELLIVSQESQSKKDDVRYFNSIDKKELSPDPFDDCVSPDTENACSKTNMTSDTQQDVNELLNVLDSNLMNEENLPNSEDAELNPEKSKVCGSHEIALLQKSSTSSEIDKCESSYSKKRKSADSLDSSSPKLICKKDTRTARKLQFVCQSDQSLQDNATKEKIKQSICSSSSKDEVEPIANVSNSSCVKEAADVVVCDDSDSHSVIEISGGIATDELPLSLSSSSSINSHSMQSRSTLVLMREDDSFRNCNSEEFETSGEIVNKEDCDVLGDLCADYEYENFCASYSPPKEKSPPTSLHQKEIPRYNSPGKELVSDVISLSSPVSVKNSPRKDSSLCLKTTTEKKLRRVGSCSDVSTISHMSSPSPVLFRCISQTSIHLECTDNMNKDIRVERSPKKNGQSKSKDSSEKHLLLGSPTSVQKMQSCSLNSVKRLLEDSFSAELEKNFDEKFFSDDTGGRKCSTPSAATPDGCENSVTPLADYSAMSSPMLKRELQKFGLKPMKPKRAKQMLRYIYNELHPMASTQSDNDILQSVNISGTEDELSFHSSQGSSSSSRCEFEVPEDLIEDSALTQTDVSELPAVVHRYILSKPEIHMKVLLYEPISLEELQNDLRAQNHKFKLNELMEYLDRECITFRTAQGNRKKKKRAAYKNRE